MNNTISEIDLTRALPPPLRQDKEMLALAQIIGAELQENSRLARLNIIYARIDELPENVLDILARDLHVDWYDDKFAMAVKREVINNGVKVHKQLGTKWAVERILLDFFGNGKVTEWFEYSGEAHRFRISVNNLNFNDFSENDFLVLLNKVKRLTSWLDFLLSHIDSQTKIFVGASHLNSSNTSVDIKKLAISSSICTINAGNVFLNQTKEGTKLISYNSESKTHCFFARALINLTATTCDAILQHQQKNILLLKKGGVILEYTNHYYS